MGFAGRTGIIEDSAERVAAYHGVEFDLDLYMAVKMVEQRILAEDARTRKMDEERNRVNREAEKAETDGS